VKLIDTTEIKILFKIWNYEKKLIYLHYEEYMYYVIEDICSFLDNILDYVFSYYLKVRNLNLNLKGYGF